MNGLHRFATGLALFAMGTGAAAQSSYSPAQQGMRGSGIRAGIVIPFGGSGSSAERAPRLEAWSDHGRSQGRAEQPLRSDRDQAYGPPLRLGVTLAGQPRMIRNGQEVPGQADRRNVSALGWVGITVGVAAVVVGLALAGVFGQCLTPC